jgi:hypothetical protein
LFFRYLTPGFALYKLRLQGVQPRQAFVTNPLIIFGFTKVDEATEVLPKIWFLQVNVAFLSWLEKQDFKSNAWQ